MILCDQHALVINARAGPGGGTHIFGRMGMCRSNGLLFYKKSLNMGPIFYQKILKHGSTFLNEHKIWQFLGFLPCENPPKLRIFWQIGPKWPYFSRKIHKNGYPFWPKSPLKMGMGFEAWAAHPCPTQIWVPPGARVSRRLTFSCKQLCRFPGCAGKKIWILSSRWWRFVTATSAIRAKR